MGPYCNYCGTRCFVPMPTNTPLRVLNAYDTSSIVATCSGGQAFEKDLIGYCYDEIQKMLPKDQGVPA
jgi:hypothetical protein